MVHALSTFAARRAAGVLLAALAETGALVALSALGPANAVGLPAAVAMAISCTVAVVFGTLDGVLLALLGAGVFAASGGWAPGELAALGVWPGVALAVGSFARRVEQQRRALGTALEEGEDERRRLALELHDGTAQTLTAALLTLKSAERVPDAEVASAASSRARELIETTIRRIRDLSVELRPRVLDDFGLATAAEQLGARLSGRSGVPVEVEAAGLGRLSPEAEVLGYRIVEESVTAFVGERAAAVRVVLERQPRLAVVTVRAEALNGAAPSVEARLQALREQVRLLGGRLTLERDRLGAATVRAELPHPPGGG